MSPLPPSAGVSDSAYVALLDSWRWLRYCDIVTRTRFSHADSFLLSNTSRHYFIGTQQSSDLEVGGILGIMIEWQLPCSVQYAIFSAVLNILRLNRDLDNSTTCIYTARVNTCYWFHWSFVFDVCDVCICILFQRTKDFIICTFGKHIHHFQKCQKISRR